MTLCQSVSTAADCRLVESFVSAQGTAESVKYVSDRTGDICSEVLHCGYFNIFSMKQPKLNNFRQGSRPVKRIDPVFNAPE